MPNEKEPEYKPTEELKILVGFFSMIQTDPRISIAHIGLYVTLVMIWRKQGANGPIEVFSWQTMHLAKISSRATYMRLIHDLHDFKYLCYEPSRYKRKASKIMLI